MLIIQDQVKVEHIQDSVLLRWVMLLLLVISITLNLLDWNNAICNLLAYSTATWRLYLFVIDFLKFQLRTSLDLDA